MQFKPLTTWNLSIQASTRNGFYSQSLNLYSSMLKSNAHGDSSTFPSVAKACAKLNLISYGKNLHAHTILLGFQSHPYVQTSLLDMYVKCSHLEDARKLFDEMPNRTSVSWNSMISGYAHELKLRESFGLFNEMRRVSVAPNSSTLVGLLSGCFGYNSALNYGLLTHCYGIKVGLDQELQISNSILGLYVRFGMVDEACSLFESMEERSMVSWTIMMNGYLRKGDACKVFDLFFQMRREQVELDSVVFISLVSSCASAGSLQLACSVHALLVKSLPDYELKNAASLVNVYSKCGDLSSARKVFDPSNKKDVFLWTSMIGGYVQSGNPIEALNLIQKLLSSEIKPNEVTVITLLSACTEFGSLVEGKMVEEYAKEHGLDSDLRVQTSLIHMYSKCGCIERAKEIFDSVQTKDLAMRSAMINGYACHGRGEEALSLFRKMSIKPDEMVFTSLLSACSHAGLVNEGLECFESMKRDHGIEPNMEHVSCVIDILCRAGSFEMAKGFICRLPTDAQKHAWNSMLSASRNHGDVEFGEFVRNELFRMEPENSGSCVLMANMHASLGNWKEVKRYRRMMEKKGLVKETGWSRIDLLSG